MTTTTSSRLDIIDRAGTIGDYLDFLLSGIWENLERAGVVPLEDGPANYCGAITNVQRSIHLARELAAQLGTIGGEPA